MARCSSCGRNMPGFSFQKKCSWCLQHEAAQRGEEVEFQHVTARPWEQSATDQTPVTYALLAINVLVYIMMIATGVNAWEPRVQDLLHWGANFAPYTFGGQPWRLVAYMFLHDGFLHIAFNMWFLYAIGIACEQLLGSVTYTMMYILSGLGGGLASLAWHPFSPSIGASGALFGILGAMIAAYKFGELSMPRELVRAQLNSMITCAVLNLVIGFSGAFGSIDNAAHIGGLVIGAVIGAAVAIAAPDQRSQGKRVVIMLLVAGVIVGSLALLRRRYDTRSFAAEQPVYMQLLQDGKTDEAIAAINRQLKKDPNDQLARYVLAAAQLRKGNTAEAMQQYQWIIDHRAAPDTARAASESAMKEIFLQTKDYAGGEKYFGDLAKKAPNDVFVHLCLGDIASAQKKYDAAVSEFGTASKLQPNDPFPYLLLARSYVQQSKFDEALANYDKAAKLMDAPGRQQLEPEINAVRNQKAGSHQNK